MKKCLCALLLVFCTSAVLGQSPEEKADKTDQVLKQLAEISKTLDGMKKSTDERLTRNEGDVMAIKADIAQLKATLQKKGPTTGKTVPYLPDVPNGDATILIVNSWQNPAHVVVNGTTYDVPTGTSKSVRVVPGRFTYRCLDVPDHTTQERTVVTGETFRVNISPRTESSITQTRSHTPASPTYYPTYHPTYYYYPPVYYGNSCGR